MTITTNGRIGLILLFILGVVVGIAMLVGFALPTPLAAIWLIVGCILALIGI